MSRGPARWAAAAAVLATGALGCRKQEATSPGTGAASPPGGLTAPRPAASAYRRPSSDDLAAARLAGFPVGFEECQRAPGARTAVWTCSFKKESHLAHDPELRACAPLLGQAAADDHNLGHCGLVYWDPAARLPVDHEDCKRRFIEEPGVIQPRGEDLCMVFVSILDGALFEDCRRKPFAEVKEGFCRYPLAGPGWKPRPRRTLAEGTAP